MIVAEKTKNSNSNDSYQIILQTRIGLKVDVNLAGNWPSFLLLRMYHVGDLMGSGWGLSHIALDGSTHNTYNVIQLHKR